VAEALGPDRLLLDVGRQLQPPVPKPAAWAQFSTPVGDSEAFGYWITQPGPPSAQETSM